MHVQQTATMRSSLYKKNLITISMHVEVLIVCSSRLASVICKHKYKKYIMYTVYIGNKCIQGSPSIDFTYPNISLIRTFLFAFSPKGFG